MHGFSKLLLVWSFICLGLSPPPFSVWLHLFHGAGHESRRGEQLKWCLTFRLYIGSRVTTHLENLEKSGNWIVVREKSGKMEKVRESYNHHLAAAREKDITAF